MLPNFKKTESDAGKGPAIPPSGSSLGVRPASPLRTGIAGAPSIIGADLVITGNLFSKGEVQIEGEVQGDVHSTHVIVGEKSKITGGIISEEVVVRGHVMGSVRGKRVILQSTSHVEGDIFHQTLAIEQGAFFEGKSRRVDDPTAGIIRPDQRPQVSSVPSAIPTPAPAMASEPFTG